MKKYLFVSFMLLTFVSKGQKYQDIDSLLSKNSMIDALTAINKLKSNYQKDTMNPVYWSKFSKASYIVYNYDNAKKAINKAIKLSPKNAQYYFEKGFLHNKIGALEPAIEALKNAVNIDPKGEYLYWKGIVNQQLGKSKEAENDYQSALVQKYKNPELYINFAILLSRKQDYKKGLAMINKAIAIDPKHPHAYSTRATIYLYLLDIDAACADTNIAKNLGYAQTLQIPKKICEGSEIQKLQFTAEVLVSNKIYSQSIVAFTKLIDAKSLQSSHFLNRGYSYYKLKNYKKAEQDYLQGLEMANPELDKLYDNLSLLYFDQKKYIKSSEYSTKRIVINPKNHVAYLDRGLTFRKLEKYTQAEEDYNTSLRLKPNFFRAFGYRAYLNLELGKNQKAYDDAKKSVEINPQYAYGYLILGQAKQALHLPDFCKDYRAAKKYGWGAEIDIAIEKFCK